MYQQNWSFVFPKWTFKNNVCSINHDWSCHPVFFLMFSIIFYFFHKAVFHPSFISTHVQSILLSSVCPGWKALRLKHLSKAAINKYIKNRQTQSCTEQRFIVNVTPEESQPPEKDCSYERTVSFLERLCPSSSEHSEGSIQNISTCWGIHQEPSWEGPPGTILDTFDTNCYLFFGDLKGINDIWGYLKRVAPRPDR